MLYGLKFEWFENLKVVEEGMKDLFPGGTPVINGENLGMLDLVAFSILSSCKAVEEAIGMKLLTAKRIHLHSHG
ncbi:unnamed protein product [Ilex paraguariensis]|uniref:Glutathione S-transferase n=1 Tax=Ilex paraguariensis TaxID=185542 RepID=A0ABC8QPU7_9AQUA